MTFLFWIVAALLAHTYVFYPVSLIILGWIFSKYHSKSSHPRNKVSIIIAAYNEEKIIEEKIRNCLELDYPEGLLEIIIGSDGSTDRTNTIIERHPDRNKIKFYPFEVNAGKAAVLNQLTNKASGDILLFCDANTMLLKNSVQKLISNFKDDEVGCVCGRLILQDSTGSSLGKGESLYWALESEIKKLEGGLGIVLGANGGVYAIRKELYRKIPEKKTIMDDFFITTQVLVNRKSAVYEPLAIGSEQTSVDKYGEFKRKVRIGQANFNMFKSYLALLNPRLGVVAYSFFSHKFLRWLGPVLLLALFLLNLIILFTGASTAFYWLLAAAQTFLYLLALMGFFANRKKQKTGIILTLPFYFTSMNIALFWGMIKAILGSDGGMWDRIERAEPGTPT
ncbi:glycosyltransferase family 2 protein [Fibrobacterota bacterium]